ncbi:putative reverse transcriptase domain-containing protein [Tanacetum coccineum]|uniref:Reverse transcriptase domain-containing protein n=1 Tax=Tanacetum coccineum TaxID=301880 RepID=A0ABQ5ETD8_9ASTR
MSVDSAVTYTSVHSEARSWSIPSEDPYEEAARQLLEQAPRSPEYVPDPIELEDHVPVYIPEPEHPEDLVPAEDEAPIEAYITEIRAANTIHLSIHHSNATPLFVTYTTTAPSTTAEPIFPRRKRAHSKRLLLTTPRPGCEVGESSAAARQPGPTMARRVDCSSVDTVETRDWLETNHTAGIRGKSYRVRDSSRVATVQRPAPTTTTTTVTEAQLQALIDRGVAAAMAEAEASRVRNGYDSNGSGPRPETSCRDMPYFEFLKCKPWTLKALRISDSLEDDALTWWNAHVKTTTPEAAHAMPWATLKKMMTDKYCPRGEIKKIETEMWNLKKCNNLKIISVACPYDTWQLKASKPKTMQEAIEFTTELMDEKTHAYAERQAEKKRKYDDLSKNNQNQQQQNKRQNTGQAYTASIETGKPSRV